MGLHVFYETVGEYTDFFQKTIWLKKQRLEV